MPTKTNPGRPNKRKTQLDATLIQLSSQRPSDVWRGMEQVRQWLKEDPEDREVYGLLLDAVEKNRELREQVRSILVEMMQNNSEVARQAILQLPSGILDILADADDAYYAAEYEKAVQLYRQVLRLDPENDRAKDHLAKAALKRDTGELDTEIPRAARQYYRRARSFIAARDIQTATSLLNAAIETAQAKGLKYPEAEDELNNLTNLALAEEFLGKAKVAQEKRRRKEAMEHYQKALKLDPTNTDIRQKMNTQWWILNAQWIILIPLIIVAGFITFQYFNPPATLVPTSANTITTKIETPNTILPISPTIEATKAIETEAAPLSTSTLTPTLTLMPPPTLLETTSPSPTEETLGIGYINKAVASVWNEPNTGFRVQLGFGTPLILLEERLVSGSTWYRCRWENEGKSLEGWILKDNINFGPPPP